MLACRGLAGAIFWCAEHTDFYKQQYLSLAHTGGSAHSGNWTHWFDDASGTLKVQGQMQTTFGNLCAGPYSWCIEQNPSVGLVLSPAEPLACEAYNRRASPVARCPYTGDVEIIVGSPLGAPCGSP